MANKEFKTLDEQIEILEARGLSIPDKQQAKEFLKRNNYYRVSGYSLTLRNHDVFEEAATFQNIIDIYEFDHELRHVLLRYLEAIEVSVKSVYAHEFTRVYGPNGYLDASNYTNPQRHKEIMDKAEDQKGKRLAHEAYLKHFVEDLQQDVPLWAYVDLLTISDISFLYSISNQQIKDAVAAELNLKPNGSKLLGRFMHSMTIIRNLCAHGSRLYNRLFEQKPWLNKKELALLRVEPDGTVDNAHLFGFILLMRRLLATTEFSLLKTDLVDLKRKYPFVSMRYYGFPENWASVL